jgi:prepilin-type N-terminal cleavage/methylation domain-containing protein
MQGFTLVEVLVAVLVMTVALVATLGGFQVATSGIVFGREQSTAAYLAEQRIEEVKAAALRDFTAVAAGTTTEASVPNAPSHRRSTTVTDAPGGVVGTKLVRVTVFYRRLEAGGSAAREGSVDLWTVVTSRQ